MGRVACVFSCGRRSPLLLQAETAFPVLPLLLILLLGGLLRSMHGGGRCVSGRLASLSSSG